MKLGVSPSQSLLSPLNEPMVTSRRTKRSGEIHNIASLRELYPIVGVICEMAFWQKAEWHSPDRSVFPDPFVRWGPEVIVPGKARMISMSSPVV